MNRDLAVEEHEEVDAQNAIQIAENYLGRATEKFASGEDAISATTFGFSHSPREFIEFCINGRAQISHTFEAPDRSAPWFLRLWNRIFRHQEDLRSRDELVRRIEEFYSCSSDEILERYKRRK